MKKKIFNHIQFLRGISVLLVFFYHLKFQYFEYGFLGVDIFFVISGFVITSLIYDEILSTKKFDFYNFYLRRFKRIYPVLFFILSASLIFIIFFQPLDLFLSNLKVYFFSLIGISNFYYFYLKKDYFDTVFDDPLAHTWSLGVEEQFYIIFPLFLFFLLKIKNLNKNIILLTLLILIGMIFTYIFQNNIKLIFYSPLFRFWEFLAGTLTFIISRRIKFKNNYLSLTIFLMLLFLILIPKNISLPTIIIITSILTSIFILIYKKNENRLLNFIVENKFFIFLGNISYSFYLWHLPVIYFYDLYFLDSLFRIPILFLSILILSNLTYIYVENKFRYHDIKLTFKKVSLIIFTILLGLVANIIAFKDSYENSLKNKFKNLIYNLNYLEKKINYTNRVVFYKINIDGNEVYRFCTQSSDSSQINSNFLRSKCLKKGKKNDRIFFIEGNSHTVNFIPMFNKIKLDDSIYFNHKVDPLVKINYNLINNLKKNYKEIIYTTSINDLVSLNKLVDIQRNLKDKVKILILGPIPNLDDNINPLKCLIKNIDCRYNSEKDFDKRNLSILNSKIERLVDKNSSFNYFDPYKIICPNKICKVFSKKDNLITHRDESHLTIEGSLLMEEEFIKFYKKKYEDK